MDKLVYSVKETAQVLNIGMNKAYELIQCKQIPSVKVGRKFLVPRNALENWLSQSVCENQVVGV